jgi:hypothetical protein
MHARIRRRGPIADRHLGHLPICRHRPFELRAAGELHELCLRRAMSTRLVERGLESMVAGKQKA